MPEVYINTLPILLDTVMDFSHHDVRVQFEVSDSECSVNAAAEFLAMHSADSRIVLASCKDSLLQALGTLTCHKVEYVHWSVPRNALRLHWFALFYVHTRIGPGVKAIGCYCASGWARDMPLKIHVSLLSGRVARSL